MKLDQEQKSQTIDFVKGREDEKRTVRRQLSFVMMLLGFLIILMPMTGTAAEISKYPDWVLDTIILPVPINKGTQILDIDLFKDKNGKIVIRYYCPSCVPSKGLIDLTTHQETDLGTLVMFKKPKSNNIGDIVDSLNRLEYYIFNFNINNTSYKVETGALSNVGGKCSSPLGRYLRFNKKEKEIDSYMLLVSSVNKFKFKTNGFCYGMNGKEIISLHNFGTNIISWIIDDNRIVFGDMRKPFLVVVDAKKIDLALKGTKTLLFDHDGLKGYWIKKSIIDEYVKGAEKELMKQGYDLNSKKPLKGNISLNEYIDKIITNKLNETN